MENKDRRYLAVEEFRHKNKKYHDAIIWDIRRGIFEGPQNHVWPTAPHHPDRTTARVQ